MLLNFSKVCFGTLLYPAPSQWKLNVVPLPAFSQVHIGPMPSRCAEYQIQPKTVIFSVSAHHVLVHFLRWLGLCALNQ